MNYLCCTTLYGDKPFSYVDLLFPTIILQRLSDQELRPYFIDNKKDAKILQPLTNTANWEIDKFHCFDSFINGQIKRLNIYDKIIIEIHKDNLVEEIICNLINIFQKKNPLSNDSLYSSELQLDPVIMERDYKFYHVPPINLSVNVKKIVFKPYYPVRVLQIDKSNWFWKPYKVPRINGGYYWPEKNGLGSANFNKIFIDVNWNEKYIILSNNTVVNESTHKTSSSHSSFDPEDYEVTISISCMIYLCLEFSTDKEINDFINFHNGQMINDKIRSDQAYDRYIVQFPSSLSIREINQKFGFVFSEDWRKEYYRD